MLYGSLATLSHDSELVVRAQDWVLNFVEIVLFQHKLNSCLVRTLIVFNMACSPILFPVGPGNSSTKTEDTGDLLGGRDVHQAPTTGLLKSEMAALRAQTDMEDRILCFTSSTFLPGQ